MFLIGMMTRRAAIGGILAAMQPEVRWKRPLGEGYSGIAIAGSTLYTMYRRGDLEVVAALDRDTGATIWEDTYPAHFRADNPEARRGPHCTPQVAGDLLITAGVTGLIHVYDRASGKLRWSRDLRSEFRATEMGYGYSSHPLIYRDSIIVMAGGLSNALIRFRLADGAVVWKGLRFKNSNSSPVLITVDGEEQVILYTMGDLMGVRPSSGELLWSQANSMEHGLPIVPPLWCPPDLLFVSSAYEGSRLVRVSSQRASTVWAHTRVRNYFHSMVLLNGVLYVSSGTLTAMDLRSGRILWQTREMGRAQLLYDGGKLISLAETGTLSVSRILPGGVQILSAVSRLKPPARTIPALSGKYLYLRDHSQILACAI